MTSDVRYASGELPQVGDVVERVEYPIGYLSLGDQVTVRRIVNDRSIDVGSDAVHYGIKQFKLIRRAHHAQQPAPVETFVPVWGPEWEYVTNYGTVFTFLLDDKSDVAPIKLACEFGDVWFSRDGAAAFGASWVIVSQRPRTTAPVETKSSPKDRSPCCGASVSHVLMCDHCASEFLPEPPAPSQPADVPQESAELTELRERLAGAEEERDEPKASFDLEDDGTPEYGTPAYELFDKAITWTVHQLKNVLGVKEWSTSGGGTDTLDGDLRMELNDLLKAAGRDDDSMEALRADLARAKEALIHIGSFFGCSAHLPWFSDDACDEVSAIIDAYGGEKRYDPALYETYCARVIADIVTGALSASAGGDNHIAEAGKMVAELHRQSLEAHMRGDLNTADRIATLIGDELPSKFEKDDLKAQHEEGGE